MSQKLAELKREIQEAKQETHEANRSHEMMKKELEETRKQCIYIYTLCGLLELFV